MDGVKGTPRTVKDLVVLLHAWAGGVRGAGGPRDGADGKRTVAPAEGPAWEEPWWVEYKPPSHAPLALNLWPLSPIGQTQHWSLLIYRASVPVLHGTVLSVHRADAYEHTLQTAKRCGNGCIIAHNCSYSSLQVAFTPVMLVWVSRVTDAGLWIFICRGLELPDW